VRSYLQRNWDRERIYLDILGLLTVEETSSRERDKSKEELE
jgi:hypothetical protein